MITITLDEQGDFEGVKDGHAPVFIGGILYDDKGNVGDYYNEERRIEGYLRAVCESVACQYPNDLHFCTYFQGGNNGRKVAMVKQKLTETLGEFLQKGTYNHCRIGDGNGELPARQGKYHIFCMLKSDGGKAGLLGERISELVKDNFASNLYLHMAEEVVARILFHNPILENVDEIRLDIATRRVVLDSKEVPDFNERVKEYRKLGYRLDTEHSTEETKVFLITNPDVYRTAMEREMMNGEKASIQIDWIGVKSIYYKSPDRRMVFLYLADIICSILGYKIKGEAAYQWMEEFKQKADRLTGEDKNLLFAYDIADSFFAKAWKKLEEKDYYKALSIAYEGRKLETPFAPYYKENWYPKLLDMLAKEKDVSAYTMALHKLQESIMNNNLNQDKVLFILKGLELVEPNISYECKEDKAILYELYDTGVAAYCHIGDSKQAMMYFHKCEEYAPYIGIERYLGTRNQVAVLLNDSFQPERALEIAKENYFYHELIADMKQQIFEDEKSAAYLEHAKTLSQLAQAYAFAKDSQSEGYFLKALQELEPDSPNYLITLSYLLHDDIQRGEREKYLERSKEYFGQNKSLDKQLKYLIKEGMEPVNAKFTLKYALYVYVKGIYTFRLEEISDSLLEKLASIRDILKKQGEKALKQMNGHPWELICKYLAFLMLEKGRPDEAERYMHLAETILENKGPTIEAIILFGKAEYYHKIKNKPERDRYTMELWQLLFQKMGTRDTDEVEEDGEKRYEQLERHFQFMYR